MKKLLIAAALIRGGPTQLDSYPVFLSDISTGF